MSVEKTAEPAEPSSSAGSTENADEPLQPNKSLVPVESQDSTNEPSSVFSWLLRLFSKKKNGSTIREDLADALSDDHGLAQGGSGHADAHAQPDEIPERVAGPAGK